MVVRFRWQGKEYVAKRLDKSGKNSMRVGWPEHEVPEELRGQVEPLATRPGMLTLLVPLVGPNAATFEGVQIVETRPKPAASERSNNTKRGAKAKILAWQVQWAAPQNISLQKGNPRSESEAAHYVHELDHNLFQPLSAEARSEFGQGSGTPLKSKNGTLPHLFALHNSDAIAVNVFDYWKSRDCRRIAPYLGMPAEGVANLHFEQKFGILPGGTKPNIDIALRYAPGADLDWVGIEAKLTETYPAKLQQLFDDKYFRSEIHWEGLAATKKLAESFRGDGNLNGGIARHLNRGQLIKHLLGLRMDCRTRRSNLHRVVLGYLWYDTDCEESKAHRKEVADFAGTLASDGVRFFSLTWQELISRIVSGEQEKHPLYTAYLKDRYLAI